MTSDNLLLALRKYAPTPDRDPREDFITEAFAWLLRAHPSLGEKLLALVGEPPLEPVQWRTQGERSDCQPRVVVGLPERRFEVSMRLAPWDRGHPARGV